MRIHRAELPDRPIGDEEKNERRTESRYKYNADVLVSFYVLSEETSDEKASVNRKHDLPCIKTDDAVAYEHGDKNKKYRVFDSEVNGHEKGKGRYGRRIPRVRQKASGHSYDNE